MTARSIWDDTHPWGHGAQSVSSVDRYHVFDCDHKAPRKDTSAFTFGDDLVCLTCALLRCPVCSVVGRNVALDGSTEDERL